MIILGGDKIVPVLSLNEFELNSKIQVYPNPTVNNVKIDFIIILYFLL